MTMRKPVAVLCLAVLLLAALIPATIVFFTIGLIELDAVRVAADRFVPREPVAPPALLALGSCLHLARASLPA